MRSEFELIENPEEAQAVLVLASTELASASFWTSGDLRSFFGFFTNYSKDEKSFEIKILDSVEYSQALQLKQINPATVFLFSVSTSKAVLFFKCSLPDLTNLDGSNIRFSLPSTVYRVQRRRHLRYTFPEDDRVLIKIQKINSLSNSIIKYLTDLSAGGFSLVLPEKMAEVIATDDMAKGIEFMLQNQPVKSLDAIVRHRQKVTNPEGGSLVRIGFEFQNISDEQKIIIQNYVNIKIRQYFQNMNVNDG